MKKLIIFLVGILFSLGLIAGQEGNGGDAITCNGITELLDYYEGRELLGYQNYKFGEGSNELEIARYLLQKLDRDILRYTIYIDRLENFMNETMFVQDELVDIPDHGHIFYPANCVINQVAIQVNPSNNSDGKRYIIHEPTWNALSIEHKAGLIIHELIFREVLESRADNSKKVRIGNALLANMSQQSFSLDTVVDAIENDQNLTEPDKYYSYNGSSDVRNNRSIVKFYETLYGGKRKALLAPDIVSSIFSKGTEFGLLNILTRRVKIGSMDPSDEKWNDYIGNMISPIDDKNYAYDFSSTDLKNKIQETDNLIVKAILSTRLPMSEYDYRLDLLEEISTSDINELKKATASAQLLGHLFRMGEYEGEYKFKDRVYENASPEGIARLFDILFNNHKLLLRTGESSPFYKDSSYGKSTTGILRHFGKFTANSSNEYRIPLTAKLIDLVNNSSSFNKVQFTNLIDFLSYFNDTYRKKNSLNINESNYLEMINRSDDYLEHKLVNFWNFNGNIALTDSMMIQETYKKCVQHRNLRLMSITSYGKYSTYCERILMMSNNSHEVQLTETNIAPIVRLYLGDISFYRDEVNQDELKFLKDLVHYNLKFYPNELKRLSYAMVNIIINKGGSWDSFKIKTLSLFDELDDNIASAIEYSFDKMSEDIKLKVLEEIIGNLSTLSPLLTNFLNNIVSGSYSPEIKAVATEILNNGGN